MPIMPVFARFLSVLIMVFAIAIAIAMTPRLSGAEEVQFETTELTIETNAGMHVFTVEVAITPKERARGLMFRRELASDRGMLFLYSPKSRISMWMKNTLIPLDMVFIRADGQVVAIHENAVPGSLDNISSGTPARAVLELDGGTAGRLGIGPGDWVRHAVFAN